MANDVEKITNELAGELVGLEGLHGQNLESGAGIDSNKSYLTEYTNRLFGSPYQLLDSVDRRFKSINEHLGSEYLRNFILNSPILYIKPGLPRYTGGTDPTSFAESSKNIFMDTTQGDMPLAYSLVHTIAKNTIFGVGAKLQRRMFGFRERYYDYMQNVNYMCRSMAVYLNLTTGEKYPDGAFVSGNVMEKFASMRWENYRFLASSKATLPSEYLGMLLKGAGHDIQKFFEGLMNGFNPNDADAAYNILNPVQEDSLLDVLTGTGTDMTKAWSFSEDSSLSDVMVNKVASVAFMVEPIQFSESLNNTTAPSLIESTLDTINEGIGSEIAFITGSRADFGMIEGLVKTLGSTVEGVATSLAGMLEAPVGGFISNLFTGAIQSIKGQKMIYPEIYKSSKSHMDYQFAITLTTPYGDPYNYFMNIVVPLMHLIALASPRMVTANSVTSPFLVQAYIPGMCSCQLGIIEQMNITKNPNLHHVSVHGFPLTVKVEFTVRELYNAMAISPANDPASFMYNETLDDYMANLAGLVPSADTKVKQRQNTFGNLDEYMNQGMFKEDLANIVTTFIEDKYI